jgi:hypothetical protein
MKLVLRSAQVEQLAVKMTYGLLVRLLPLHVLRRQVRSPDLDVFGSDLIARIRYCCSFEGQQQHRRDPRSLDMAFLDA